MKKKILVIGTGGTIVCTKTKNGLRPAYSTEELISFFPEIKEIADVEGKMLFNVDSTNMQPHHWSQIAEEIKKQYDKYDGFIITHGTDTMQYTASALSFMLQNLSKPVVLTGSVKAIGEGSDAKQNFIDSVIVACSDITDVCLVFHGKIIKGCKARKITNESTQITNEPMDVYSSINYHLLGELIGELKDNHIRKVVFNKEYDCKKNDKKKELTVMSKIAEDNVLLMKIYPGFKPELIVIMTQIKYLIIEAFGPGNIPFMENSLIDQIEKLTKENIPVFITTQNPFGEVDMNLYEVGQKAMKAGAISCKDMTSETTLVKLMWVLGNFPTNNIDAIKELMMKNFVGEIRT
ncbi:MAG: asparaginase [Candidatus Aenigmarchaeota archaeon]|nr:asparaginase [Candidatus Aenigmarchaeota archaeon]